MEIRASCKFDLSTFKAAARLGITRLRLFTVIYSILAVIAIAEMILWGINGYLIILLCIVAVYYLMMCYMYFIAPKKNLKAHKKRFGDTESEYIFGDDEIRIITKGAECNSDSTVGYQVFFKAYETPGYFFLYQSKRSALVVDKKTVTGGTPEQISEKLSAALGKKFKVRKK